MGFPKKDIKQFFDVALAGESKTYNDHNWYTIGGLKGYIEGRNKNKYSKLDKPLSQYTIGQVKSFQSNSRFGAGQLWATGRYQIIPDTLKGITLKSGLSDSDKYNQTNQDKLALQLLMNRTPIKKYLTKKVEDNKKNLESASLSMAQIWSSIGVPYFMMGNNGFINKNQSYYAGGGDKASVKTEDVQKALKKLRQQYDGKESIEQKDVRDSSNKNLIVGISILAITLASFGVYLYLKKNKPNLMPKFLRN
jgi:hypothetical protein